MNLVQNAVGKMQNKIAVGLMFLASIAAISSCTLLFFEEEVPQVMQENLFN